MSCDAELNELSWADVIERAMVVSRQIPPGSSMYPVPRGGMFAALAIASADGQRQSHTIVERPSEATVYVDDIVDGIISSLEKSYPLEVFNLGSGRMVPLMIYIEVLERAMGKEAQKRFLPMQPGDIHKSLADISHAEEKLGYAPKVQIESGIANFVDWYRKYYNA